MKILIDGDILAFAAASVHPDDKRMAVAKVRSLVKSSTDACFAAEDEGEIYVKGDYNFRDEYSFYKANRSGSVRPATLEPVRAVLASMGTQSHGGEADDFIVIRAQELFDKGEDYVISSLDKDLKQMHGKFHNYRTGDFIDVTEEQGLFWLHQQCITGDSTDGIPGIRGIGPKKSEKFLQLHKVEDRPPAILELYYEHFGSRDQAFEALEACWNCVYMRKRMEDVKILPLPKEFLL
jgi:hypothetical protein